jgi:hypothetical protein
VGPLHALSTLFPFSLCSKSSSHLKATMWASDFGLLVSSKRISARFEGALSPGSALSTYRY